MVRSDWSASLSIYFAMGICLRTSCAGFVLFKVIISPKNSSAARLQDISLCPSTQMTTMLHLTGSVLRLLDCVSG